MRLRQPCFIALPIVILAACGSTRGEPIKPPLPGERCDVSRCPTERPTDVKTCENGDMVERTECVADGVGRCSWEYPVCPGIHPVGAGGGSPREAGAGGGPGGGPSGLGGQATAGAGGQDGGDPSRCSANSVTIRVKRGSGAPNEFCLGEPDCTGRWFRILDSANRPMAMPEACVSRCDECNPGCALSCAFPSGLSTERTSSWDGTHYNQSTCGPTASTCFERQCAAPGRYTAHVCYFANPDPSSSDSCRPDDSSKITCVDVPFEFPSASEVTITIPPDTGDGGAGGTDGGGRGVDASANDGSISMQYEDAFNRSLAAWQAARDAHANTYRYSTHSVSWIGSYADETVGVRSGAVESVDGVRGMNGPDGRTVDETWSRQGAEITADGRTAPPTVDQMYEICRTDVLTRDPSENEIMFRVDARGILGSCLYIPNNCADDCARGVDFEVLFPGE